MSRFLKVVERDTLNLFFNPTWVMLAVAYPLLLIAILGGVTAGFYSQELTSFDYYGITMMVFLIMNTATYSANSFLEEKNKTGELANNLRTF